MDPVTLAAAAVALLGPYLARIGGRLAEGAGDQVADAALPALGRLYEAVRRRFAPGTYPGGLLAGVEERPEHEARRRALADALAEAVQDDRDFADALEKLVADAGAAAGTGVRIGRVEGPVAFGGSVVQKGRYVAGHDLVVGGDEPRRDEGRRQRS